MEFVIKKRRFEDSKFFGDLWQRFFYFRKKLMEIFYIILNQICFFFILESSCDNIQGFIEEFFQIFSFLLQEKRFFWDYDVFFFVVEDISLLQQVLLVLDEMWIVYIFQVVESVWEGVDRWKVIDVKDLLVIEEFNGEFNGVMVIVEVVS